jgi:hypothetical protein
LLSTLTFFKCATPVYECKVGGRINGGGLSDGYWMGVLVKWWLFTVM